VSTILDGKIGEILCSNWCLILNRRCCELLDDLSGDGLEGTVEDGVSHEGRHMALFGFVAEDWDEALRVSLSNRVFDPRLVVFGVAVSTLSLSKEGVEPPHLWGSKDMPKRFPHLLVFGYQVEVLLVDLLWGDRLRDLVLAKNISNWPASLTFGL